MPSTLALRQAQDEGCWSAGRRGMSSTKFSDNATAFGGQMAASEARINWENREK